MFVCVRALGERGEGPSGGGGGIITQGGDRWVKEAGRGVSSSECRRRRRSFGSARPRHLWVLWRSYSDHHPDSSSFLLPFCFCLFKAAAAAASQSASSSSSSSSFLPSSSFFYSNNQGAAASLLLRLIRCCPKTTSIHSHANSLRCGLRCLSQVMPIRLLIRR